MMRPMLRRERRRRALLVILAVLALLPVVIKLRYGGGAPYPDVSTTPLVAAPEVLIELDMPPGNVTCSRDGRIFFNSHPFAQSHRFTDAFLWELVGKEKRPYPDASSQLDMRFVFGMTVDAKNRLWLISPAELDRERTRVQAYDLATNKRVEDHEFAPGVARFSQDLRVSPDGHTLFLADTGALRFTHGAILVVDTSTWEVRETLDQDVSTAPEDWVMRTPHGPHRLFYGLVTFQVGVDGIALSRDGAFLYFAPMTNETLYRVRTEYLLDPSLSRAGLAKRVETVSKKPMSDGIELAADGSVIVTDVENGAVARVDSGGHLTTLIRDPRIVWSDGVAITPGGDVLLTDSAISAYTDQLMRPPSVETLRAGRPYRIYRFHLPAPQ
jgi:hypothetical protein